VWQQFPTGKNAQAAHWRLAWVGYLERRPEAAALLEEHLRRFPTSSYAVDALYWLGRAAERNGNVAHAHSFYQKAQERFAQTYFGRRAAGRLRALGATPVNAAGFMAQIPSAPPLPRLDDPIPPSAEGRWARAKALRTIAFDASAELELRAAYAATAVPRLLWEAAKAALDARRYPVGISLVRQVYPQLEARRIEDVPLAVWRTAYPLPFEQSLRDAAARHRLDPMLVAGVIRQESAFQTDAISRAGAVGLMQVLPKTGRKLAGRLKLRYAQARLFDPEYNLRLGTLYLADLLDTLGSAEAALAAFNAGEERVGAWQAERSFEDPAEFVESIPITETRDYVQIVMRNAELYRLLYQERR
jgi:soluble lytic murein transglycosylase